LDDALRAWAKDFGEKTNGRYTVEVVSGGTLASTLQAYDALVGGVADVGLFQPPMTEKPFPLANLPVLFWGPVSAEIMTDAWQKVYNKGYLDKELSEIKIIGVLVGPVGDVDTVKPVKTLAEMKGVKLANAQGSTCVDLATALGAVSVLAGPPDIYALIQKGTTEGLFGAIPMIKEFHLDEFVKYLLPIQVSHMSHVFAMNLNVYNSLPDDIKLIFNNMAADRKYTLIADQGNDKWYADGLQYCLDQGLTQIKWSNEDMAKLNEIAGEIWEKYLIDLEAQGLPAREVCDELYNSMLAQGAQPSEIAIGYTPSK
jgi:TRAP-type C4-dicarboxylate transport system substrate-binding protein